MAAGRRSWIEGILCVLLGAAALAGSAPSGRSGRGVEPPAQLPAPGPGESVPLSIEQRIVYQRRIEEVYWRRTSWPETNPQPKPSLGEVLSDAAIRSKVDEVLRKSAALEVYWKRPITAEQLQAEVERMARATRHTEMLRELFAALDDDPFVIAECLARPALADRLLRNWYAFDERFHGTVRTVAESAMAGAVTAADLPVVAEHYEEVALELERGAEGDGLDDIDRIDGEAHVLRLGREEWSEEVRRLADRFGVSTESVTAGSTDDEIEALLASIPVGLVSGLEESADGWHAVTVLSKGEDSVRLGIAQWPKRGFSMWWSASRSDLEPGTGPVAGAYTLPSVSADEGCTPDTWRISLAGLPTRRTQHTAVWTGSRMIVWGGQAVTNVGTNSGGVYDPATDSWTPTSVAGAPSGRYSHTAVWTGDRMIVWGGASILDTDTGGVYDPATDSWTPTSVDGAPFRRSSHTAVWTGDHMIVWGGTAYNTGGVYDPTTNSWTPTAIEGGPSPRTDYTAVWTANRMIVWGGFASDGRTNTGGVYDPTTNSWTPTAVGGAPSGRVSHTAVSTGDRMIVWGGVDANHNRTNDGGVYDPATDSWTPTSVAGAPSLAGHTAVWADDRMIVWGGVDSSFSSTNAGGVYDPATNSWRPTSVQGAPSARVLHRAVWTGDRMIVWGGNSNFNRTNTGGVYVPAADSWTPTSVEDAPSGRRDQAAVWTGARMIVWGGDAEGLTNTGGVYDPATNSWTPTSLVAAPLARVLHTAVWTGDRMVVWGGVADRGTNTGGVYDPATDTWTPTSLEGAPSERWDHTAVWTGDVMIVWGGVDSRFRFTNAGGVYDPAMDSWTPISLEGAPSERSDHTAVWTGGRMIVWGGVESGPVTNTVTNTGGVYDPSTDSWTPTEVEGAPMPRGRHTALWTGSGMVVWGGQVLHGVTTNTGGVYDPATDSWGTTSVGSASFPRSFHTALWTGARMIVWGGVAPFPNGINTGGVYDPATDSWTPTAVEGAPPGRWGHTAVYTGSEMLIWGGSSFTNEVGAYCFPAPAPTLTLDIKPGDFPNVINPRSRGVIPVAIQGSAEFDVTTLDVTTLRFGPGEAVETHDLLAPATYLDHLRDVNLDGYVDLMLHFRTLASGIECDAMEVTLSGETESGLAVQATDSIVIHGCTGGGRSPLDGNELMRERAEGTTVEIAPR